MKRKGLLLAGGTGSRLFPVTLGVSKQLLPVYDKPMVFHPLCTLMAAGIRDIAVITTPDDAPAFRRLLGDGSQWGIALTWLEQRVPDGLPRAFTLGERFLAGAPSVLVLGDNLFHGPGLAERLRAVRPTGATVWAYQVADPERYGVLALEGERVVDMVEKPQHPPSSWVLTGLYHVDGTAPERARALVPSARGELEITDLLRSYLQEGTLSMERLGAGFAWLDTGTHASLLEASSFVRTLQVRQGLHLASPERVAFANGWLDVNGLLTCAERYGDSAYGRYVRGLATGD